MTYFDFKSFWNDLTKAERKAFSVKVGLSEGYISTHLRYARRSLSLKTSMRLMQACNDLGEKVSLEQVSAFFMKTE